MNSLFIPASTNEKGTLAYLKNYFHHQAVKKDVTNCFNHANDFINFVREGYICLFALDYLELENLDDRDISADPMQALDEATNYIVDNVWIEPDTASVTGNTAVRKGYCLCEDGT